MPGEDEHVSLAQIELALSGTGFRLAIESEGRAFWEYHSELGTLVLDWSKDWVLWSDVYDQLIDLGLPTKEIEDYLDGAV